MEPWSIGLVAVIVVCLALIVFGALSDRAKNRRAAVEMLAPPSRDIPRFQATSAPPRYLSELQARRPGNAPSPTELTPTERAELATQIKEPSTVRIAAGFLSRDFVTDRGSAQAVVDAPRVLVCADHVESIRELLGILEKLVLSRTPLVVVAPSMSAEVLSTLEVNRLRNTLGLLAIGALNDADRQLIADATGAEIRSRSDLQAGYVWPEHLGDCGRWVSSAKASFVIAPGGRNGEPG